LTGEFADGFSGLKAINSLKPDIIFLDIQMPRLTGFEMLELLDERPEIIFTTAYDQYAIKAFEENAVDYLLKPFSQERFTEAVNKAILRLRKGSSRAYITKLNDNLDNNNELINRVVVKLRSDIKIIPVEQIIYLESQDDYVMIYIKDQKFLKQKTMKFFENHLDPQQFVRVHRSYMVKIDQINKIEPYEKSSGIIILKDGRTVPISRSGLGKLKEILDL
jgi:two-component system LytT family response regulator